ncbi:sugar ABC transporter substrate-binding protein [Actinomadura miaoliensis]|uniref:Sugar ABC transporter substrate-binding protein n=1 Tax=Actinomadura miaoliensis TaxID=430685 RepID=A0ABP7WPY3_9ACTN
MTRRGPEPGRRTPLARVPLAATAIVAGGALALGACGGGDSGSSGGTTTITYWDTNASAANNPRWNHTIAEFEKRNPTIKVKYVGIPIAQVQQKLDTAIATGGLPDAGGMTTALLAGVAGQGALEPLDERLAKSPLNGKINNTFLQLTKQAGPDGKLYELPSNANMGVLWYRPDWFKDKGLKPPETWDDFYTAAERLTDAGDNRYGYTIRGGAGSIAQVLEFMYAQSGITQIFDAQGKATLNDPRNVAALQKTVALYKKNTPSADVNNDYIKMTAQFDGGTIGMMQHNLGSYGDHKKALGEGRFAGVPIPALPDGTRVVISNPIGGTAVFKSSKHKDAAWKFAEFVSSKEMTSYWSRQQGQIPANTDAAAEPWIKENPTLENAIRATNDPKTKIVQLPYHLPEFNAMTKAEAEPQFQKVLLGQLTPQAFLDELAKKFTEAEAEFRERKGN